MAALPRPLAVGCSALALCACVSGPISIDPDGRPDDSGNEGNANPSDDGDDGAPNDGDDAPDPGDGAGGDGSAGDGAAGDGASGGDGGDDSPGGANGARAFGEHATYPSDVIVPNHVSREQLDADTAAYYDTWKSRYLEDACVAGQKRVHSESATAAYTVSEAHGYGMMFAVYMEGHDPEAHAIFDGLYRYFRAHPSDASGDLMAWAQDKDCNDVLGSGSAADGDLDIAYALLLADAQWGSGGEIDYKAEGNKVVAAILAREVAAQNFVQIGSWAPSDTRADGTRSSDIIPAHFRAYQKASGEARWGQVVEKLYGAVQHLQGGAAQNTGLLPDFIVDMDTDAPAPAPASWLEGAHDGQYNYNACRVPWRLAADYLVTGEPRAREAVRKINAFVRSTTGDDPSRIVDGYDLSGSSYGGSAGPAFLAPFLVGAMVEPEGGSNQTWINALWDLVKSKDNRTYYNDSLQLAGMLVASGNYWTP